jgi:alkylresorcinol/alkylpyrone synthase
VKFPQHHNTQDETIRALTDFAGPEFRRFAMRSGVEHRHTALPLARCGRMSGFTEANDAYIDVALDLAEQALLTALDEAEVKPSQVDIVFSTTVTGLSVPRSRHGWPHAWGYARTSNASRCSAWAVWPARPG